MKRGMFVFEFLLRRPSPLAPLPKVEGDRNEEENGCLRILLPAALTLTLSQKERAQNRKYLRSATYGPHPNPLPKGEGTEPEILTFSYLGALTLTLSQKERAQNRKYYVQLP